MRRSWTVTALFLLMFVVFWEVRTMMRVQPIAVSPAEVMQLAARSESAADMERVRAHLAAHGVRILASEQRAR